MTKLINQTRVILISGSSHVGKSTLGRSLAAKLSWNYLSTDTLARHPGRPWVTTKVKTIPEHVVQHYQTLSVEALFLDVLDHYQNNVLPQVEAIVHAHSFDLSRECLVLEGSALWPKFVANLVDKNTVKAIWLTASEEFFRSRILAESNFDNVNQDRQYLIQKFLARTLLYDQCMRDEVERLGFICVDVESLLMTDDLANSVLKDLFS
ncbi:2-phosphoglycerate kinase [Pleurocapsa sp. CCALA 161]|uniref:2-phosphoglycerate kinase n=1 Tax=Pleurocapsa sp. CCALA 161 TaxID=2107688 RepID=UPI000D06E96D|nr:2-phosphoglycerate kinase [Pleurocapsa sp. CCALA 161]PSB08411.1 2-phosphoglycerate kinase [Pleurocapsa sp. CCALA 161]